MADTGETKTSETGTSDETAAPDGASSQDDATSGGERPADRSDQSDDADDSGEADETPETPEEDEGPSEPVDQTPALRAEGTINLGICHFGGAKEPASILASRSDGTGWIAVCDDHKKDAEEQGFVLEKSQD